MTSEQPKWRREPERRPDDILDGALIEFRTRGFSGARIEDIAKHAGLSKGTVYLYFSSKEDMLKALIRRAVTPITHALTDTASHISRDGKRASEILTAMLEMLGKRLSDDKVSAIPLLIIGEAGNFPELASFYRNEVIDVSMGALKAVLDHGIKTGEFRDVDLDFTLRTLMGALIMQVIWNGTFARPDEERIPFDKFIRAHLDLFLHGIVKPQED